MCVRVCVSVCVCLCIGQVRRSDEGRTQEVERENAVGVCIVQCTQGTHYLSEVDITALYHARIRECKGCRLKGLEQEGRLGVGRLNRATSICSKLVADSPLPRKIQLHFSTSAPAQPTSELFTTSRAKRNDIAHQMNMFAVKFHLWKIRCVYFR